MGARQSTGVARIPRSGHRTRLGTALLVGGVVLLCAPWALGAPDAIVLIQPQQQQALIAVTYPGPTPHSEVAAALTSIARGCGAQLVGASYSDDFPVTATGKRLASRKQTSGTAMLVGVDHRRGDALLLQPYAEAFAHLSETEILFLVPRWQTFRGLRRFEDSSTTVTLTQEGGPYRYTIRRHGSAPVPQLPLIEDQPTRGRTGARSTSGSLGDGLGLVAALGAVAGALVFAALWLRIRLRAHSKERSLSGTWPPT